MIKNKKLVRDTLIVALVFGGSFLLGIALYKSDIFIDKPDKSVKLHASIIDTVSQNDFKVYFEDQELTIKSELLKTWVEEYTRNYLGEKDKRLSDVKLNTYLNETAKKLDSKAINARITISSDSRASVFVAEKPGKKINIEKSFMEIGRAIFAGQSSAKLVIDYTEPEITLDKINTLGIETIIGKGESDFSGSPASRVHNIKTATEKFNGLILKPGEEFSFNQFLGEVDGTTGYKPELVIKSGKLEYEYGGGICQVSTTVFRAAIYAGLPIKERKNHSFPVRYYNPQGFDSTVYPGIVDLKFTNDTAHHILIQGRVVKSKLVFEVYGTSDGRTVKVDPPVQYDQKPDGSMKAYFNRTVILADGKEVTNKFSSVYKPPVKYETNPLE